MRILKGQPDNQTRDAKERPSPLKWQALTGMTVPPPPLYTVASVRDPQPSSCARDADQDSGSVCTQAERLDRVSLLRRPF